MTTMASIPKLAIFDIDGTIAQHQIIPDSVLIGLAHLQDLDCITTISSWRSFNRVKHLFGNKYDQIISPKALLIVEHGTKIVDRSGRTIFGEYFSEQEKEHIIDFTRANVDICLFAAFDYENGNERTQIYCFYEEDVARIRLDRGHYADVTYASMGELKAIIMDQPITNISIRLKEHVVVQNLKLALTRSATTIIFQDGWMEFIKNNINKGLAVLYLEKKLSLTHDDLLLAGNAINDVEMLNISAARGIIVGSSEQRQEILQYLHAPDTIIGVDSPGELGHYLQTIGSD
jgi:HAD superfamily hydrolase (TIGR01484 family)